MQEVYFLHCTKARIATDWVQGILCATRCERHEYAGICIKGCDELPDVRLMQLSFGAFVIIRHEHL
jgi:hypothetical protein